MVPVTPSFPLFKLPYLAWKNVFQTMDKLDLFQASLGSKKMKHAVSSLFRKPNRCGIVIDNEQFIIFISGAICFSVGFPISDLLTLDTCSMRFYECQSMSFLTFQNFCPKNWFDHIVGVFHVKEISSLSFGVTSRRSELIDPRIFQNLFQGFEISQLTISAGVRGDYIARLLDSFPNIQNLRLFIEPRSIHRLVERKFNSIQFYIGISVYDILSLKAKFINAPIQDCEFNNVLKKWVEGWNPLLTGMKLTIRRWRNPITAYDGVFDGIDHEGPLITEKGTQFTIKNDEGISATIIFNKAKPTDTANRLNQVDVDMIVADH